MMRTMRSSESVCSCSKPPPRQSRRSPDETSKTKKKHHTRDKALPGSIDLIASKRPTRKGISSAPPVVGLPLTTLPSHFKLLLHHCLSILAIKRPPPFPRPKIWRHGPILQIEIAQIFSCYILLHWISNFIFTTCLPCVLFLDFFTCKAFLITWRKYLYWVCWAGFSFHIFVCNKMFFYFKSIG